MKKAVVFDLDGTLLNTLEDLSDSVNAALRAYDCPLKTMEQVRTYVGNGIRRLMQLAVEGGEEHQKFEEIFCAFQEHYAKNSRNKTRPYEGILELLRSLHQRGIKMAIVSNKADFAVKDLNAYYFQEFDMIAIGEKEGIRRKPAPDTVFLAMQELGVSAEETIFVGDSDVDMDTAGNAHLQSIGVLWGFRDEDLLRAHGAQYLAKNPADILTIVEELEG